MAPRTEPSPAKTPELVAQMQALYRAGWKIKHISIHLGVPRTNVYDWLGLEHGPDDTPDGNARSVDEYHDELRTYAEHYRDPNVVLLGDPPLHRSALWKKLEAEG